MSRYAAVLVVPFIVGTLIALTVLLINALRERRERRDTALREARRSESRDYATFSGRPAFDGKGQWRRGLLPAALVVIGLTMVVFADFTGDHRVGAGGVAIVGAAILMAIAGWLLRRPDGAAQFELRDWASYLTQTSEQGRLFVRPDQTDLYECAVRAFGADRVLYDRRQGERRRGVSEAAIERRQSERRQRVDVDFDIKATGSAWIRV